jgi:sugar lactone lactonase YvrE
MGIAQLGPTSARHGEHWAYDLGDVRFLGKNLRRPECVLSTARGDLFVAALGHGVVQLAADGGQFTIGNVRTIDGRDFIPNGLALEADGSFLVTNMGEGGGLWRLRKSGTIEPVLLEGRWSGSRCHEFCAARLAGPAVADDLDAPMADFPGV